MLTHLVQPAVLVAVLVAAFAGVGLTLLAYILRIVKLLQADISHIRLGLAQLQFDAQALSASVESSGVPHEPSCGDAGITVSAEACASPTGSTTTTAMCTEGSPQGGASETSVESGEEDSTLTRYFVKPSELPILGDYTTMSAVLGSDVTWHLLQTLRPDQVTWEDLAASWEELAEQFGRSGSDARLVDLLVSFAVTGNSSCMRIVADAIPRCILNETAVDEEHVLRSALLSDSPAIVRFMLAWLGICADTYAFECHHVWFALQYHKRRIADWMLTSSCVGSRLRCELLGDTGGMEQCVRHHMIISDAASLQLVGDMLTLQPSHLVYHIYDQITSNLFDPSGPGWPFVRHVLAYWPQAFSFLEKCEVPLELITIGPIAHSYVRQGLFVRALLADPGAKVQRKMIQTWLGIGIPSRLEPLIPCVVQFL